MVGVSIYGAVKMSKFEGTNFLDFKKELLRDSRERQEYERLQPKYMLIQRLIERRNELHLSQEQLANIIGMKQPAIARLESGVSNTTVGTLLKVADALKLDLEFKARQLVKS